MKAAKNLLDTEIGNTHYIYVRRSSLFERRDTSATRINSILMKHAAIASQHNISDNLVLEITIVLVQDQKIFGPIQLKFGELF
jgi:hypothetical protein